MLAALGFSLAAFLPQDATHYANGRARYEGRVVDGQRDGQWVELHPNGSPARVGRYRNGTRIGRWLTYDELGRIVREEWPEQDRAQTVLPAFPVAAVELEKLSAGEWTVGECLAALTRQDVAKPAPSVAKTALASAGPLAPYAILARVSSSCQRADKVRALDALACCTTCDDGVFPMLDSLREDPALYPAVERALTNLTMARTASSRAKLRNLCFTAIPDLRELGSLERQGILAHACIPDLEVLLYHPYQDMRHASARALAAVRNEPRHRIAHWRQVLLSADVRDQREALAVLAAFRPTEQEVPLAEVERFLDSPDRVVRWNAWLVAIDSTELASLAPHALSWWRDGRAELRQMVHWIALHCPRALTELVPDLIRACEGPLTDPTALLTLGLVAPGDPEALAALMANANGSRMRRSAIDGIRWWIAGANPEPRGCESLRHHADQDIRCAATFGSLVREPDVQRRFVMIQSALADPSSAIRSVATRFVPSLGPLSEQFTDHLRRVVLGDPETASPALGALAQCAADLHEFEEFLTRVPRSQTLDMVRVECLAGVLSESDGARIEGWSRHPDQMRVLASWRAAERCGLVGPEFPPRADPLAMTRSAVARYVQEHTEPTGCFIGVANGAHRSAETLSSEAVPLFAEILNGKNEEARTIALRALTEFGSRARDRLPLLVRLFEQDPTLGGHPRVSDAILAVARDSSAKLFAGWVDHENDRVRTGALQALAKLGSGYGHLAYDLLERASERSHEGNLAFQAVLALGPEAARIVPTLRGMLCGDQAELAIQLAGSLGVAAAPLLDELLVIDERRGFRILATLARIAPSDARVHRRVRAAVEHPDRSGAALEAIGELGEHGLSFKDYLRRHASDPDESRAKLAIDALYALSERDPSLLGELVSLLEGSPCAVRCHLLTKLTSRVDSAEFASVRAPLADRAILRQALARMRPDRAERILADAVLARTPETFSSDFFALARHDPGHPVLIATLLAWIEPWNRPSLVSWVNLAPRTFSPDARHLREALEQFAVHADLIDRTKHLSQIQDLLNPLEMRNVFEIRPAVLPELVRAIADPDTSIRECAARLLEDMGSEASLAFEPLLEQFHAAEPSRAWRLVPVLARIHGGPHVRGRLLRLRPELEFLPLRPATDPALMEREIDRAIAKLTETPWDARDSLGVLAGCGARASRATLHVLRAASGAHVEAAIAALAAFGPGAAEARPWLTWQSEHGLLPYRAAARAALRALSR